MNPSTSAVVAPPAKAAPRQPEHSRRSRAILVYIMLAVASAWWVDTRLGLEAGSDLGYWIGVAGGTAMLLLFLYPLRKRAHWLRNAGSTRTWFIAHMVLGISGPWLILVHCGFHIGSMNAAVALFSMLIVATSGVIGRFIYVRVHLGLSGKKAELGQLRDKMDAGHQDVRHHLASVPAARDRLFAFEDAALDVPPKKQVAPYRPLQLWWMAHKTLRAARAEIDEALRHHPAMAGREHHQQRQKLRRSLHRQAETHVRQVKEVAQFAAWEHLFALWHVLHIPFLYVMVICAVIHVVAVHAY